MLMESICAASCGLIVYHHVVYPVALRALASRAASPKRVESASDGLPLVTLIIPAHNEPLTIADKVRNSAVFDYPAGKLKVIVACDGCTDATVRNAREAIDALGSSRDMFELIEFKQNRGKVAVLNDIISRCGAPLVALSDASALLDADAIRRAALHFAEDSVGFVTGSYDVCARDIAVRTYWSYQNAIKRAEGALGAPIGAHGAFYIFRRSEWMALEADTINDDVMLPMRIAQRGFRGVYDETIRIHEAEQDTSSTDLRRRRRLAAGALQQALRLGALANPRRPGLAFSFLSGKALRAFMPFIMIVAFATNAALAFTSPFWASLLALQLAFYGASVVGILSERARRNRVIASVSYLGRGHINGLIGAVSYVTGQYNKPWTRERPGDIDDLFIPAAVMAGKRMLDIVIAACAFVAFIVLFVPIALAIRLESKGPIFYRQLRVGLRTSSQSRLFYLTKFRTMRVDAEARSGAVWASKNDPRITRVGNFLRKTRLDELPQCMDVLRGDMSIVGPRPERPQFFTRLESNIPFYAERTYGLKPGITGLAQVTLPV